MNKQYPLAEKRLFPYVLAGWGCVQRIHDWRDQQLNVGDELLFMFEKGSKHQGALMDWLKTVFGFVPQFGCKKEVGALQSADFVAWEFHKVGNKIDLSDEEALKASVHKVIANNELRNPFRALMKIHQGQQLFFLEKELIKLCQDEGLSPRDQASTSGRRQLFKNGKEV